MGTIKKRLAGGAVIALLISGCSGPAAIPGPGAVVPDRPQVASPPVDPSPASIRLLEEARANYRAGNWPAAIVSAERGLRIERRSADLYLVLAQSYLEMAEPWQAGNFARQGMRYTMPDSELWQLLKEVLKAATGE